MMPSKIERLLKDFQQGKHSLAETLQSIQGIAHLDYAQLDIDRKNRTGQSECIFGEGKTSDQIIGLCSKLFEMQQWLIQI